MGSEYEIKAPWLVNFMRFSEWPVSETPAKSAVIVILGRDPFKKLLAPIEGRVISGKKVEIWRIGRFKEGEGIPPCALLFVALSEADNIEDILAEVYGRDTLTVSEIKGFIKKGGMINFVVEKERIRFDVNQDAMAAVGLRMNSQLLIKARRVIRKRSDEEDAPAPEKVKEGADNVQ